MDILKLPRFSLYTIHIHNSDSNNYVKVTNHLTQDPLKAGQVLI